MTAASEGTTSSARPFRAPAISTRSPSNQPSSTNATRDTISSGYISKWACQSLYAEKKTNHPARPEESIVDQQPGLLRETERRLLLLQTSRPGDGTEDPVNGNRTDRREANGGTDDIVDVIPALDVNSLGGLVV